MSYSVKFIDSFDYTNTAGLEAIYEENTGNTIPNSTGRNGGIGLQIGETGGDGWVRKQLSPNLTAAFDEFTWGAAIKVEAVGSTGDPRIVTLYEGTTPHLGVGWQVGTNPVDLRVYRGTTTLATIDSNLTLNTWYHLQLAGKINDTTGYYYVYLDNILVASGTSQDTRNAGTTGLADRLAVGFAPTAVTGVPTFTIDDQYLATVASGPVHLGDLKVGRFVVTTSGSHNDFTPLSSTNVSNVDETNTDSDTTYNESSTVGHIDTFNFGNIPTNSTVYAVQQETIARKTDAGARTLRQVVRSGGSDFTGSDITMHDNYETSIQVRETDPATSSAWAPSAVNAAEVGYKVQA